MAERSYEGRPLLDKLGIKPGMRVAVIGVDDAGFMTDLQAHTDDITTGAPLHDTDAVFLTVEGPDDMRRLTELRGRIQPGGAVWAVFRKGRKEFNENDVMRLGLESGLVDVKVVRFSETHTALKFVIRKAERPQRP
jgi:hypothetical protein